MIDVLVSVIIAVIVICVVAGVVLWAVQRFFAELYPPARLIVGAFALVLILFQLLRLVRSGIPGFS